MTALTPEELIEKGILYFRLVQLDLGMPLLEEAYQKAMSLGHIKLAMKAQAYLLRGWAEKGNNAAISKLKEEVFALSLSSSIPPTSQFYYTLGLCGCYEGKFEEAKFYCEKALNMASGESIIAQAYAELGLSIIYVECAEYEKALNKIELCKQRIQNSHLPELMVMVLLNEGRIHRFKGHFNDAIKVFKEALKMDKYQKNLFGYLYLLYEMSLTYFHMNQFSFAQMHLDLAKSAVPEMSLIRLEKLLNQLQIKISSHDYDLSINTSARTIVDKIRGEINLKRQGLMLDVLLYLVKNQGKSTTKEELSQAIWNENYKSNLHDNKIYVTIKRLRNILETDLKSPKYILSSREGYFFNNSLRVAVHP